MSFLAWLMLGSGVFLLYCAYKGYNPIAVLSERLGIAHRSSTTLRVAGAGGGGGGGGAW